MHQINIFRHFAAAVLRCYGTRSLLLIFPGPLRHACAIIMSQTVINYAYNYVQTGKKT